MYRVLIADVAELTEEVLSINISVNVYFGSDLLFKRKEVVITVNGQIKCDYLLAR